MTGLGPGMGILGLGLFLPPAHDVRELARAKNASVEGYASWDKVLVANDADDQPSTMGARALCEALKQGDTDPSELSLVVFAGVSRDFPASWSVATEVMSLCGAGEDCIGLDLTIGCAGALAALELAQGWLAVRGGGVAAIVCGERWAYTVDHADPSSRTWAWSDNGGAIVVAAGSPKKSLCRYLGAEFSSRSDYNGHVLVRYGGSRHPVAPEGVAPYTRRVSARPREEIRATYKRGYALAYERLLRRVGVKGRQLVCNQISPVTVALIAEALGFEMSDVVLTGHELGHMGSADIIAGLDHLLRQKTLSEPTIIGASTAYSFGAGILVPAGPEQV